MRLKCILKFHIATVYNYVVIHLEVCHILKKYVTLTLSTVFSVCKQTLSAQ